MQEVRDIRRQSTQPGGSSASCPSYDDAVYALQKENTRLKAEIQNIQTRRLRGYREPSRVKQEYVDGLRVRLDDSEVNDEATHHEARNNEARERLKGRVVSARIKYREAKLSKSALQESVHETESQLALVEDEHREVLQLLEGGQARLIELHSKLPFDFSAFLKNPGLLNLSVPPTVELTTTAHTLSLPQTIIDWCSSGTYICKTREDVVWSQGEDYHTRFLLPEPSHHYHPTHNGSKGTWVTNCDSDRLGKQTEFFHYQKGLQGLRWRYMGTYQHVGICVHPLKVYGDVIKPELLKRICQQTMLSKDMIPPVLTKMVRQMYDSRVLKIACTAWRRAGYNRDLADALRAADMLLVTGASGGGKARPTGREAGSAAKRDRDEDLEAGPSEKRRKDE
ncbi:hypothetical protein C8Q80DRAFT_77801 [Daedaleopsis nitida]|nr:hypothetical protein C8Q80DRAFT_77801 [Daedaleopsis nitida]